MGRELHRSPTEGAGACTLLISRDGNTLACLALSRDHKSRRLEVWDLTTGRKRLERLLPQMVWGLALSPDGRRVVWSADNEKPTVYDTITGKEIGRLPTKSSQLCFSADGKLLAGHTWNSSQGIHLWDATSFQEIRSVGPTGENMNLLSFDSNGIVVVYCH